MCRTLALVRTVPCNKLQRSSQGLTDFLVSYPIGALADVLDSAIGQDRALQQTPTILTSVDEDSALLTEVRVG